jgi:gliding-associated putative ABC transporter substrate-binding component GldG
MKRKNLLYFFIGLGVLVVLNVLAAQFFFRVDLTEDKRYTISPATRRLLENLDDQVFVTVYLAGDLPAGFQRLRTAVRERLEEFEVYGGRNIRFQFTDPLAVNDKRLRNRTLIELGRKGLKPTNVFDNEGGKRIEKVIIPGAVVQYGGKETSVMLLRGNQATKGLSAQQILNQSVENVEYELASAIKELTAKQKRRVGLIRGYGGPAPIQVADLINGLQENYDVYQVNLPGQPTLQGLDAVLVIKPDSAFTEADKYKLDQFIVNGGKALFFVDALKSDTLNKASTLVVPQDLNLGDLFFRYGVRLNDNMVQDLNAALIPLNVGRLGDRPQIQPMPWRFFPLVNTFSDHPTVRNLDAVYVRYAGSMDTVRAAGIEKTPLLFTSKYTKLVNAPVQVDFNEARQEPDPATFNAGNEPLAYLLEGRFRSLYANRITANDPRAKSFKSSGRPSRLVVCSDGDIPVNDIDPQTDRFLPLGLDRFSGNTFANKDFVLNLVGYLVEPAGIITARAKEVVLRPLDKLKVQNERIQWQVLNVGAPLVLIGLFGALHAFLRKRKFAG